MKARPILFSADMIRSLYTPPHTGTDSPEYAYQTLWQSINGAGSWAANPWVWALTSDVIQANVNDGLKREAA